MLNFKKNSFENIEYIIRNNSKNTVQLGEHFANLCKYFFDNSKYFKTIFRRTWHWNDWPYCWGRDKGIDLVAQTHSGDYWAIQAKGYDKKYSPNKKDFDTFLSESERKNKDNELFFSTRLMIASSWKTIETKNFLDSKIIPTQTFLRKKFLDAEFNWPNNLDYNKKIIVKKPPPLFGFQKKAISNCLEKFKNHKKGKLIMACGTGKTYTSLRLNENKKFQNTLYIVPSISLIDQTLDSWLSYSNKSFIPLVVCSAKDVLNKKDGNLIDKSEIIIPPTTDPDKIIEFFKTNKKSKKVVFSTYQSLVKVILAQQKSNFIFDLTIFDEAHHTAGEDNDFSIGLDDNKVKSKKKLFMTATPLIISEKRVQKFSDQGFNLYSMDNTDLYGPKDPFFKMPFNKAIDLKILANYKVIGLGLTKNDLGLHLFQKVKASNLGTTDIKDLASKIGLIKATEKYNLKRIITFHSNIDNAENYINEEIVTSLPNVIKIQKSKTKFYLDTINSRQNTGDRKRKLNTLKNIDLDFPKHTGLITNCFCLGEGVDVPELDCVAFISEKHSPIEIVQAVGRAIRKPKQKDNKKNFGYIFIPLLVDKKEIDPNKINGFKTLIKVIKALRAHDEELSELIDTLKSYATKGEATLIRKFSDKINIILPKEIDTFEFAKNITTEIINFSADNFEVNFLKLKKYYEEHGNTEVKQNYLIDPKFGVWVNSLRVLYKSNSLSNYKIEKLKSLKFRFDTKPVSNKIPWEENFKKLLSFYKVYGNSNVPRLDNKQIKDKYSKKFVKKYSLLGFWVRNQRKKYKEDKLSKEQIQKLNSVDFIFDPKNEIDRTMILELFDFYKNYSHFKIPRSGKYRKLALWVTGLRQRYKIFIGKKKSRWKSSLSQDILNKLKKINFTFDSDDEIWKNNLIRIENLWKKNGKSWIFKLKRGERNPDYELIVSTRLNINKNINNNKTKNNRIDWQQRKKDLEKIGFPFDQDEYRFLQKLDLIKKFKAKFGHTNIKNNEECKNFSSVLVNYLQNIKYTHQMLSSDHRKRLIKAGIKI